MKKLKNFRKYFVAALLVGSMGLYASCDSCNRTDGSKEGAEDGRDANSDTRGSETPADNENSGRTPGTNTSGGNSSDNSSASTNNSATNPSSGSRQLSEEEITNQVENSNASNGVDSKGNPVRSGGTSGTGQGTGTGSTGNNSKVTSREDQKS